MKKQEFSFNSATGVCKIYGCEYLPDNNEVKAVVAIHHGMAEHQQRYRDFISFLTENGFAVFMHDMANHGRSKIKRKQAILVKRTAIRHLLRISERFFLWLRKSIPIKK